MDVNFFAINLSSGLEQFGTVASRKDFLSKWHLLLIYWKRQSWCCLTWGLSTLFTIVAATGRKNGFAAKLLSAKFDAKECKLGSESVQRW